MRQGDGDVAILILGMHRSGTSCLAGCLEQAGLHLGEVNTAAPFNKKGNRENPSVTRINDQVLSANAGSWRAPPSHIVWPEELRCEAVALIAALAETAPWGFKDPRTLLTLDGWLDLLDGKARLVASFRHPAAVALSLSHRPGALSLPLAEGLALWRIYNERLLALALSHNLPLISYDWPDRRYADETLRLAESLNLPDPAAAISFFDASLRSRSAAGDADLPQEVAELYAALLELAC